MNPSIKRFFITSGEPAGIGPDVTLRVLMQPWSHELIVIGDPKLFSERARIMGITLKQSEADLSLAPTPHEAHTVKYIPCSTHVPVLPGKLNVDNAPYVMKTLKEGAAYCLKKKGDALITAPVHKGILNEAGIPFTGHTEFLQQYCNTSDTLMLFVVQSLKVAFLTTHMPLRNVPSAITSLRLHKAIATLEAGLKKYFHLTKPCILVLGLNPHAGEGGWLGREEIDVITPTLDVLRDEGLKLKGPLAADTALLPIQAQKGDAILAMYHDQVLPVIKYMGFDQAVNVTLGLPFLRTSPDHGVALDQVGKSSVNANSMMHAVQLTCDLLKES